MKNTTLEFPEQFDFVKEEFLKSGVWEARTTEYVEKNLKTGQTFVDVGANVGYYSILASELGAKVLAFEPSANNRKFLEKNCDVQVFSQALSNENGSAILYTDTTPGQYSLMGSGKGEKVDCIKYDDLKLPIGDFYKIDAEVAEKNVL